MKDHHKGALLDLDRRSRENAPSRRSRLSGDWVALTGRLSASLQAADREETRQDWLHPLPLGLAAFRAGRLPLLQAADKCRRQLFVHPLRLTHFLSIHYSAPPSSLQEELAWVQELRVRQVILPLDQAATDLQQVKALGAIQNLRTENCRVSAVLRPKREALTDPEAWHQFCYWILAQVGWQLERVQLGDGLDTWVREHKDLADVAKLFRHVPRLRHDYPGVALLAPGIERADDIRPLKALQQLLPEGGMWDGVTVRTPPWQTLESVSQDGVFLRRLTLASAVALRPDIVKGKVQLGFPPQPVGCDSAAAERIAGSILRRSVLALTAGVADRVAIGLDPTLPLTERKTLTAAIRELMAQLKGARFERRIRMGDVSRDYVLEFSRQGKPPVLVGWTDGEPRLISAPFRIAEAHDYLCRTVPMLPHPRIRLTRNMAYFVGD